MYMIIQWQIYIQKCQTKARLISVPRNRCCISGSLNLAVVDTPKSLECFQLIESLEV